MRPALRLPPVLQAAPGRGSWRTLRNPHLPRSRAFTDAASHPSSKVQFYLSRSTNPYLNLSIEHLLLQKTPPESTVLFLYTNRPCIVIGRNQNPWVEANLPLVESLRERPGEENDETRVELVRRRSGGGAVFHDGGNVNYSVICPPATFDRNKHAEMVVRALRGLGVPGANVNCRHDVVVDTDPSEPTPESCLAEEKAGTFKVSGSAFKLTRLRSLHHGTCLLSSPNLPRISEFLRSPGAAFIRGRGVESVRSKVRNVGVGNVEFEEGVRAEFKRMYGGFDVDCVVSDEAGQMPSVRDGMSELRSRDWIYGQTPRFTFSTAPTEEDPRPRPALDVDANMYLEVRQGVIQSLALDGKPAIRPEGDVSCFYDLPSWDALLETAGADATKARRTASWLQSVLGSSRKTV